MPEEQILIIEDEAPIRELLSFNLAKEGYRPFCTSSGEEALEFLEREPPPGLILLDLMLPGTGGLEVCKIVKSQKRTRNIPVIILSALGEESDIVAGLELGADDYVTKPFSPRVLLARIKAALRRREEAAPAAPLLHIHNLSIDETRYRVLRDGEKVALTSTEFKLLLLLARHPGRVFTRDQIVTAVHGSDYPVTDRSVDVQVAGLRKKLGSEAAWIETVRGIGYRFKEETDS